MFPKIIPIRQVRNDFLCLHSRFGSVDKNLAAGRTKKSVGKLDQRCLSTSVRTEQPDDLTAFERDVQIVECEGAAVFFCQSAAFEYRFHCFSLLSVSCIICSVSSSLKPS